MELRHQAGVWFYSRCKNDGEVSYSQEFKTRSDACLSLEMGLLIWDQAGAKPPLCNGCGAGLGDYHALYDGKCESCVKRDRDALLEALKEIEKGQGAFSMDHLTHAVNTIEDMKQLAKEAIATAEGRTG